MIFLHKRFAIPPFFRKKLALSIVKVLRNIHLLPHFFFLLSVSEVRNISNKFCLLNKSAKETFLHLTPFLCFKNNLRSPLQKLLETSTYYHIFTNFHGGWGKQYFKYVPSSSNLRTQFYNPPSFEKKLALFIASLFGNIHFLLTFHFF